MSERPKREKKLAPQLLAFFETKNSTGFFAGVTASRKQAYLNPRLGGNITCSRQGRTCDFWFIRPTLEQDVAEVENTIEESEEKDSEESLAGIFADKDIFKTKLTITAFTQVRSILLEAVEKQIKVLSRTQDAMCIICYEKTRCGFS